MQPVTIVTVVHDAFKFAELCVKATHRRTPEQHKHVIIDNGSGTSTLTMLRRYKNSNAIDLWERRLPKNASGHARSLNWYLYTLKPDTELVCLLDSDAYPVKSGWLTELYQHMEEQEADATGFPHFRDNTLLHPACMLFKMSAINHAGNPDWRISKRPDKFHDTGMIACTKMREYGAKLLPLSEEVMNGLVRHRWCGTRIEIAKNGVLDGHMPRDEYDQISSEWFSDESAKI